MGEQQLQQQAEERSERAACWKWQQVQSEHKRDLCRRSGWKGRLYWRRRQSSRLPGTVWQVDSCWSTTTTFSSSCWSCTRLPVISSCSLVIRLQSQQFLHSLVNFRFCCFVSFQLSHKVALGSNSSTNITTTTSCRRRACFCRSSSSTRFPVTTCVGLEICLQGEQLLDSFVNLRFGSFFSFQLSDQVTLGSNSGTNIISTTRC